MFIHQACKKVLTSALLLLSGQVAMATEQSSVSDMFDRQALIDSGIELPPRYGVSLLYVNSEYTILTKGFKIGIGDQPPAPNDFVNIDRIDARAQSAGVSLDAWLLPMLRVYTTASQIEGDFDLFVDAPILDLAYTTNLEFSGQTYTVGTSFSAGYKNYFAALDVNAFMHDLDVTSEKIKGYVGTLRLGRQFTSHRGLQALWLGIENTTFTQGFIVDVPTSRFGTFASFLPPGYDSVTVDLGLKDITNGLAGAHWKINDSFFVATELRFEGAKAFVASLEYRFGD